MWALWSGEGLRSFVKTLKSVAAAHRIQGLPIHGLRLHWCADSYIVVRVMQTLPFDLSRRPWASVITASLLLWCGSFAPALASGCPTQIRLAYTESSLPPYVLGEGAELSNPPGLFVSWARTALERMGCKQVVKEVRLPYNRIVSSMAAGTIDIRVTGGYRAEVADIMVFPMAGDKPNRALAVAEADTALYVRKNAPLTQWDGKLLRFTGPNPTIGTVRGHYTEKMILAKKWEIDSAPTWEANVKKLLAGRVAAIIGPDSVIEAFAEFEHMKKLEPPVTVDLYFAPVSLQFYEQHPAFTQHFWLEICRESRATFRRLPACRPK